VHKLAFPMMRMIGPGAADSPPSRAASCFANCEIGPMNAAATGSGASAECRHRPVARHSARLTGVVRPSNFSQF
jgi:hypothetical protein